MKWIRQSAADYPFANCWLRTRLFHQRERLVGRPVEINDPQNLALMVKVGNGLLVGGLAILVVWLGARCVRTTQQAGSTSGRGGLLCYLARFARRHALQRNLEVSRLARTRPGVGVGTPQGLNQLWPGFMGGHDHDRGHAHGRQDLHHELLSALQARGHAWLSPMLERRCKCWARDCNVRVHARARRLAAIGRPSWVRYRRRNDRSTTKPERFFYSWVKSSYYRVKSRLSHHNQAKALLGCRKARSRATVANHRQRGAMTRIGDRHCVGETEHVLETRWCRLSALPCVGLIRQTHLQTLHAPSMDVDDERGSNWLSQFCASRGFAVLQPNFRGSFGYGGACFQNKCQGGRICRRTSLSIFATT